MAASIRKMQTAGGEPSFEELERSRRSGRKYSFRSGDRVSAIAVDRGSRGPADEENKKQQARNAEAEERGEAEIAGQLW